MAAERSDARHPHVIWFAMTMLLLATPAASESLPCNVENDSTFEDWKQWTKLTPAVERSQGHTNDWVDIYADELARDTYLAAGSPYPECAKVAKPQYAGRSAETILKLTLMVKMPAGYDPAHADWWYGVARPDGSVIYGGKLTECIRCHRRTSETDYMFSRKLRE